MNNLNTDYSSTKIICLYYSKDEHSHNESNVREDLNKIFNDSNFKFNEYQALDGTYFEELESGTNLSDVPIVLHIYSSTISLFYVIRSFCLKYDIDFKFYYEGLNIELIKDTLLFNYDDLSLIPDIVSFANDYEY